MNNAIQKFLHSLIGQFTLVIVCSFSFLIFGVIYDGNRTVKAALLQNVKSSIDQTSQLLNLSASTSLAVGDLSTVQIFFKELLRDDDTNGISYVVIGGDDGILLVNTLSDKKVLPAPSDLTHLEDAITSGIVHVRNPILLNQQKIGFLQFGLSVKNLVGATAHEQRNSLIRILSILLLILGIIFFFGRRFSMRLHDMAQASQEIASGNYQQMIVVTGRDELSVLMDQFNLMAFQVSKKIQEVTELNLSLETRVGERTSDLAQANRRLEANLVSLKSTQEKLIQSEKLAGLGSLVAGVAHELNTPIGNALTVVSTMGDKHTELRRSLQEGTIKKSKLEQYVKMLEDATHLLEVNIVRAAELIRSFKTIAVNQTSEKRANFTLRELFVALEPTLRLQSKHKAIRFEIDVDEELRLDSYPGALTQVILNLYGNAILHGFDGRDEGEILLQAKIEEANTGLIKIIFSDDGVGISSENKSKIFNPFFTTKLGQGGSGLGLHISFNIVNNILGGSIKVESNTQGSQFVILLPVVAPILMMGDADS